MHAPQPTAARPVLLLTCGDPAGIGPEVAVAAWCTDRPHERARLRIVADPRLVTLVAAAHPAARDARVQTIAADDGRESDSHTLLVIPPHDGRDGDDSRIPRGRISAAGGRAAVAALETAFTLVRSGHGDAIVTGPLNKEALHAAGYDMPGHTEWLARACGLPDSSASMMLWLPVEDAAPTPRGIGVVHATLHESLRMAVNHVSTDGIVQAGLRLDDLLGAMLDRRPRIAVAALNPHAGEGGLFGNEESRVIAPAVAALVQSGIDASGPLPADTLFLRASQGGFDGVVAMYHDQGHIPIKLLGMHRAVNITLGLPIVRTSVAHGTAFDIVGTAKADATSMLSAIDAATRLVAAGWPAASAAATAASARAVPHTRR